MSKKVNQGSYGCIYQPPLSCAVQCHKPICTSGISKLTNDSESDQEYRNLLRMNAIDPSGRYHFNQIHQCDIDQTLAINSACDAPDYDPYKPSKLIFMPDGGLILPDYLQRASSLDFNLFFRQLSTIFDGVEEISRHGMIHFDVSVNNILIQPNGEFHIIDFGTLTEISSILAIIHADVDGDGDGGGDELDQVLPPIQTAYYIWPIETILLYPYIGELREYVGEYLNDPAVKLYGGSLLSAKDYQTILKREMNKTPDDLWEQARQKLDVFSLGTVLRQILPL